MIRELIRMSWDALVANKLRSLLSFLSIAIGVFSITAIMTFMDGFRYYVENTFESIASNAVYVSKLPLIITSYEEFLKYNKRENLKMRYYEKIKDESLYADHVAPVYGTFGTVKKNAESIQMRIGGATAEETYISGIDIDIGRFFTDQEVDSRKRVAVIGWDVADQLFPNRVPLNEMIKVQGYDYRIIGIVKRRGAFLGQSMDQVVYVPITTMQGNLNRFRGIQIGVSVDDRAKIPALKDELTGIMRSLRKLSPADENDFSIYELNEISAMFNQITQTAYLTVAGISLISLIVGGVGIMNIMVVSVTERTREIGIRKSIGAKPWHILMQFLIEAVFITIIGGVPAIILGYVGAYFAFQWMDLTFNIVAQPFIIGFGFSVTVGILSGFIPAYRASRMQPVLALSQ